MERGEAGAKQAGHKCRCEPAGRLQEGGHGHLRLAAGREAQPVRGIMVVRVVLRRPGGIKFVTLAGMVNVRVAVVNKSDVLKQHV